MIDTQDITGLVLAGGRGTRMGGVDKGLQNFRGMPLALHTLMRLQLQVGPTLINANRNMAAYASLGVPVWPDTLADYPGPLAGFLAGLAHCQTPWLLTVPCDTPLFPLDLAARLAAAATQKGTDMAVASAPEAYGSGDSTNPHVTVLRLQPVFCLLRVSLLPSLREFIDNGGRKMGAWVAQHPCAIVPFNLPGDEPRAFFNANTLADLRQLAYSEPLYEPKPPFTRPIEPR